MRGGGFRPCPMRRMAERPCLTAVGHRRPRKSAVAPGPELLERLRRLTHRRDGGCLVGIMTPDLARVGYPSARRMGKAGAVAARERIRLSSAGVMRPFLGRLLRARVRSVLSHASYRASSGGVGRRVRMARPVSLLCSDHWAANTGRDRRRHNALDPRA